MTPIRANAPGKLLLLGEYVVLTGAPALVMAVDRRVEVRLETAPGWLHSPQLNLDHAPLRWGPERVECDGVDGRLGMTGKLLPRLARSLDIPLDALQMLAITIDSGALFEPGEHGPIKLGLGSSGAVTAALVRAFEKLAGSAAGAPAACLARFLPEYRAALGTDASGADLAASLAGGLNVYQPDSRQPGIAAATWPAGLHWSAIWVGVPAATGDFVTAFHDWRERAAGSGLLAEMSQRVEHAAASRTAADWIEAFDAFGGLLERLGRFMGREIMTEPHRNLRRLAAGHGVVYKSCGAGGGDLGIALSTDPDALERFRTESLALGAHPLELGVNRQGASVHHDDRSFRTD